MGSTSPRRTPIWLRWSPFALLLLAFVLRVPGLDDPRFHPDEALFASFARAIAVWRDPLLATAPVDKPPLLFYLQALCYPFLGPREMAARMPNLYSSIITVALTFALAREVAGRSRPLLPLWASILVALSPLAVAFGPTAFTDPLMLAWALASLVAAARGRPGYAGLWLGLGIVTKYQAALFLPLAVGLLWWKQRSRVHPVLPGSSAWLAVWGRFLLSLGIPLALILAWDWARVVPSSFIAAQLRGYGELRLAPVAAWPTRLISWLELGRYWTGSLLLAGLIMLSGLVLLLRRFRRDPVVPLSPIGVLILAWLVGYLLLHLVINVPIWDRYLLPVIPVASLAAGWAIDGALAGAGTVGRLLVPILVLTMILVPAGHAAAGLLPIGGDHGFYDGMDQIAEFFAPYPYGTVLYDHWLSWQLRYYLFDSRVHVSWFADASVLQADLQAFGDRSPRFLIVPTWQESALLRSAVSAAGYELAPAFSAYRSDGSTSFVVYQITAAE